MRAIFTLWLVSIISTFASSDVLVGRIEEGEEIGLTHYYFYYSFVDEDSRIVRVRHVTDSDLWKKSVVVDYLIEDGDIRIRKAEGFGAARKDLVLGKDAKVENLSEHVIETRDTLDREKLVTPAKDSFSLGILIDLLSRHRQPIKKAEQAGGGKPAKRSESRSKGDQKPQPESDGRSR